MLRTLTRWEPFVDLGELRSRFGRLFYEWLMVMRARTPAIDVVRKADHLVLRADLPGIKPKEVNIEVDDDILRVSGEHRRAKRRSTLTPRGVSVAMGPSRDR